MRKLLTFAFLALAGAVQAQDSGGDGFIDPSCRINRVVVKWRKLPLVCATSTRIHLRAYYLRKDGRPVDMNICHPDPPTWGHTALEGSRPGSSYEVETNPGGFDLWLTDIFEGDVIYLEASTWQDGAPDLRWEKTIRVPVGY